MTTIRQAVRHAALAVAEGSLIASLVVVAVAAPALAGKPSSGTGSSSISTTYMDGATAANFEARVTFSVATTATAYPYVHLRCYQNRTLVLDGYQGFFPTALGNQWFYLGPTPAWTSGGASCTADLVKAVRKGWSVLASTSFPVLP